MMMTTELREPFARLEAFLDQQCSLPKRPLRYGCRMSVLFLESDYEPGETFRHPTEPCTGCGRLVIGYHTGGPIACEECLAAIPKF